MYLARSGSAYERVNETANFSRKDNSEFPQLDGEEVCTWIFTYF